MTPNLRKYGESATINFTLFEVDGVDFRINAAHASGDSAIMKNEGAEANTTNGFTDEGNGYSLVLTATEMQAARIVVYLIDQTATKVWLDKTVTIETYGHASAQHAFDLDTANVTLAAATHTGAVIPTVTTVTTLTNLPSIPSNWITAAGIAASAMNGKGDWNTGKTGYSLTQTFPTNFADFSITATTGLVTLAGVTHTGATIPNVTTVTTNTDMRGTDGANTTAPDNANIALIVADTNELQTNQGNWATATGFATETKQDTMQISVDGVPTTAEFNARTLAAAAYFDPATDTVATVTTLTGHTPQTADHTANISAILTDTSTTLDTKLDDMQGATFATATDSLEAIRNRGDAAWTTGAGGTPPQLLQSTTLATLTSQTVFTLTAGSADDDTYNGAVVIITDASTSTQKAVGSVSDYVGSTKQITLASDPAIFTMAAGDSIDIIANTSIAVSDILSDGIALNTTSGVLDTVAAMAGTIQTLDALDTAQDSQHSTTQTAIADVPTVAEFNARTLAAAGYFDPATDTVANVTTVATTTTNTDMRGTDSAALAAVATEARLSELDQATSGKMANQIDIIQTDTTTDIPATISALNDLSSADVLTTQLTESYAADGTAPTLSQALFLIQQMIGDFSISGTTITSKKLDGTTTAATFTLDDATSPTSKTRAS